MSTAFLRTLRSLHLVVKELELDESNYEFLYNEAKRIEWNKLFSNKLTFAVKTRHSFLDRIKTGKSIGQAIIDHFLETTKEKPKVNLKNPDIEIHVFDLKKVTYITIALTIDKVNSPDLAAIHGLISWLFDTYLSHKPSKICALYDNDLEEIKKFLTKHPLPDKIPHQPLINTTILDQEYALQLITRLQKQRLEVKYQVSKLNTTHCPLSIINTFNAGPSKTVQIELFSRIISNANFQVLGLILREDIINKKTFNFKLQKLAKLLISGIPALICILERE